MDDLIKIEMVFGHVRLEETRRLENGRLILGGKATHYDQHGNVTKVTQSDICSIGWDDGSPFTERNLATILA